MSAEEMAWRSDLVIAEGGSVVADGVFGEQRQRMRIERVARERHVPFFGVWLDVAPDVLWHRVGRRRGGASDATVDILSRQLLTEAGDMSWHRMEASRSPAAIVSDILDQAEGTDS